MSSSNASWNALIDRARTLGATHVAVVPVERMRFDRAFRDLCAANVCGNYGTCHICPPAVGPIDELIEKARSYTYALVVAATYTPDDGDFVGGGEAVHRILRPLRADARRLGWDVLALGAGHCVLCETCALRDGAPCRHPDDALPSLESHGVDVGHLVELSGGHFLWDGPSRTFCGALLMK
ncbi:MAG: DUF2284 domain-containing protein [Saccharofermentanales bacterium]|jgi:predicted metal-binding protein